MSNQEGMEKSTLSVVKDRRRFLKKAGSGIVITSLPAQSVWGACSVSGAMSGNMSAAHADKHQCSMPVLPNGRSPGFWKTRNGVQGAFLNLNQKIQEVNHSNMRNSDKKAMKKSYRECYKTSIENFITNVSMGLPQDLITSSDNLAAALASNGSGDGNMLYHLAAVYLNAYYGFYGSGYQGNMQAAQQLVTDILLFAYSEINQGRPESVSAISWNMSGEPVSGFVVTQLPCA
ncbi:hypothetical protein OE749_15050 [Aestuariibacter sp. AA17]|uniref:Tat pathway signal sequence domain protein n=1 Tax=Fluctibacter corallii TaxID=2984329 RepID=A0ABT3ABF9_9ALTE|nr:hypothetical protein [Aestuariibacter sp. AA17]MCV2886009.1 hypothetical protein [Aestuariibacter sp. AA17]